MANAANAHASLRTFCNVQPGIGIGKELFTYLVNKAIALANGPAQNIRYKSNTPFRRMSVFFTGEADASKTTVTFNPIPDAMGGPATAAVQIHNLSFELSVYLEQTLMSTHAVTYARIDGSFRTDTQKISLVARTSAGTWTAENLLWKSISTLPDGTQFTPQVQRDWEIQQEAFKLLSKDEFGAVFIAAIEIPNVLGMIDAFTFYGPIQLSQTADILMISGAANWKITCPRRESSPALISRLNVRKPANLSFPERIDDTEYSVPDNSPESSYPPGFTSGEKSNDADLFVYLPRVFMEHRLDGVAKPSVTFADEGSIGPIQWHYESAISPAHNASLVISLVQIWPTEFKVSLPLAVFGAAAAGVKIGCVYIEAASVGFDGVIDPFEAYFKIGLDVSRSEIYFESKLGSVVAHDFQFRHSPPLGFPLDQIVDFIFARVAETIINHQAGTILNVTRFSLAEFGLFRGFGHMRDLLAAVGEADGSSATVGVTFVKAVI